MSVVTGVVIVTSLLDGEEDTPLRLALNAWFQQRGIQPMRDRSTPSDGTKHPQFCLFVGGYDYFSTHEKALAEFFPTLPWGAPENAVLMMTPEEGATIVVRPKF